MLGHLLGASLAPQEVEVDLDRTGQPDTAHPLAKEQIAGRLRLDDGEIRALADDARPEVGDRGIGPRSRRQSASNLRDRRQERRVALRARLEADGVLDAARLANLAEALDALRNNPCFRTEYGDFFVDYYLRIKDAEIARYRTEHPADSMDVTAWEQKEYFDLF